MNFLEWVPVSVEAFVTNFRSRYNWRSVWNIFRQRIEDLYSRLVVNLIFGIYGYFLSFIHLLIEIKETIRTAIRRLALVIRSVWHIESFEELLRLKYEYLVVRSQHTLQRELLRLDEFENSLNFMLASASRVCLREVNSISDLYAHVCDLFTFIWQICRFLKCAVLYIRAKRINRRTERRVVMVHNLRNQARNYDDDEWIIFR